MVYDNQSTPSGVLYAPTAAEWLPDPPSQDWYVDVTDYLTLDSGISVADQIIVVRQADFSSITPIVDAADTWNAWTIPATNSSGSTMYRIEGSRVIMSDTAADYTFYRAGVATVLPLFSPTTDTVYILRKTQDITNYVSWMSGSHITAAQLNRAFSQLLHISQENSVIEDNKIKLDPFLGTPSGTCPLDSAGVIDEAFYNVTTEEGITGAGTTASKLTLDLDGDSLTKGSSGVKADTQDSLTSTSTTKPLSANQGKELKALVDGVGAGITFKGAGDMVSTAGETFYNSLYGTPATGDTVTHTGTGTTASASWGGLNPISQYDTIRYTGAAWIVVDGSSYIRTDGTTALHASQLATTQLTADSDTSVATTAFVHAVTDAVKLSELADVDADVDDDTSDPAGQMLYWDHTEAWKKVDLNKTDNLGTDKVISTGDSIAALDDIENDATTGASTNDFLKFNGTRWDASSEGSTSFAIIPGNGADADGTSVDSTHATAAEGSDDSTEINTALVSTTFGHNGNTSSTTVATLDLKGANYLCSHVRHTPAFVQAAVNAASNNNYGIASTLRSENLFIPCKRDMKIENGTLSLGHSSTSAMRLLEAWNLKESSKVDALTTTTSAVINAGDTEIPVDDVQNFPPGSLIEINAAPLSSDQRDYSSGYTYPTFEMNVVTRVDYQKIYLKYPLLYTYDRDGIEIETLRPSTAADDNPVPTTATASLAFGAGGSVTADLDNAEDKTLILTTADQKEWHLKAGSAYADGDGTEADPIVWDHDDSGTDYAANIAHAINNNDELTKWMLAAASTGTLTLTQRNGASASHLGENGNTKIKGSLVDNVDVSENTGTFVVSGFTYTHFTGGITPKCENVTFENVTFNNTVGRAWKLGTDPIVGINASSGTHGYFKVTLPENHNLPVGQLFVMRMDGIDIVDNATAAFTPRYHTDINGVSYGFIHPADPPNVIRTQMGFGDGGEWVDGLQGRDDGAGGWNTPEFSSAAADGGSLGFLSIQENYACRFRYMNGLTFKNCTFNNWSEAVPLYWCNDVTFENCTFRNVGKSRNVVADGIVVTTSRNITIKDCTFIGCRNAIKFDYYTVASTIRQSSSDILISGCKFRDVGAAIRTDSDIITNITVIDNDIQLGTISPTLHNYRNSSTSGTWYGIKLWGANIRVEGNRIYGKKVPAVEGAYNSLGTGTAKDGGHDYALGDVVNSDWVGKALPIVYDGIDVLNRGQGFLSGNNVVNGPIVSNNTVRDTWHTGIQVREGGGSTTTSSTVQGTDISNNDVSTWHTGITYSVITSGTVTKVEGLTFSNNTIVNTPRTAYLDNYIGWEHPTNGNLRNAGAAANAGIYVSLYGGSGPATITNLLISGNNISCYDGAYNMYNIRLGGATDYGEVIQNALITNNMIYGGPYPMYLDNADLETNVSICKNTAIMNNVWRRVGSTELHNKTRFLDGINNIFEHNIATL